ncbi:MAG: FecR domain-containing protein [Lautropia sp.]
MSSSPTHDGSTGPPMAGGLPISEAIADRAAEWLTLMMSGEASDQDRQRWQQWRAAHPDHERAWQHIDAVTRRFQALAPSAGYRVLSPYAAGPKGSRRRKALNLLLWGGAVGLSGLLASRTQTWQRQVADHHTGTGEQRTVTLSDGTRVTLDTASAIDVRFDGERRLLRLVAGEVLVATAHALGGRPAGPEDPRPLIVQTAEGRIRALGTRFSVRQHDGRTRVAVLESAVEIRPADGDAPRILKAGERTSFTRTAIGIPQTVAEQDSAWARGQIVASDMPLGDFLTELARYRRGILHCDPAVAGLRFSGVFPLHDTDRILTTLPGVLPVRVRQHTRWWVVVEAAS